MLLKDFLKHSLLALLIWLLFWFGIFTLRPSLPILSALINWRILASSLAAGLLLGFGRQYKTQEKGKSS